MSGWPEISSDLGTTSFFVLESEYSLLVSAIQRTDRNLSMHTSVYKETNASGENFPPRRIAKIKREPEHVAHELAKYIRGRRSRMSGPCMCRSLRNVMCEMIVMVCVKLFVYLKN